MSSSITITGNVVKNPTIRYTGGGTPQCSFGVAVNRRITSKGGETTESVSFFNVVTWNSLAENLVGSLHRGDRVVVVGRLDQRSWDAADGTGRRTSFELVADEVGASMRFATLGIQRQQRVAPAMQAPVEVSGEHPADQNLGQATERELVSVSAASGEYEPF